MFCLFQPMSSICCCTFWHINKLVTNQFCGDVLEFLAEMLFPEDAKLYDDALTLLKPLDLKLGDYEEFCKKMDETMSLGLKKSTRHLSSIKMFPTYVYNIPNGTGKCFRFIL